MLLNRFYLSEAGRLACGTQNQHMLPEGAPVYRRIHLTCLIFKALVPAHHRPLLLLAYPQRALGQLAALMVQQLAITSLS